MALHKIIRKEGIITKKIPFCWDGASAIHHFLSRPLISNAWAVFAHALASLVKLRHMSTLLNTGADLGGGRGGRTPPPPPPQGFEPLPTQRVPPLVLFKKSIFGRPTLNFSKGAFGANIY